VAGVAERKEARLAVAHELLHHAAAAGGAGRARVEERFTIERMVAELRDTYLRLIERPAGEL